MRKHLLVPTITAIALAAVAVSAHAANPNQLVGNWASHGTGGSCLVDPVGFNAKLQPLNPSESYVTRWNSSGVATFNPPTSISPTGLVTGYDIRNIQVLSDSTPASATYTGFVPSVSLSTVSDSTSATWQMQQGSDTITITVQNEVGSIAEGPRAGQTTTIDQYEETGYVSADGKTIVLTSPDNIVEHITYTAPAGSTLTGPQTFARLCHRSTVLIKIQ